MAAETERPTAETFLPDVGLAVRFVPDDVTDEERVQYTRDGLRPREVGAGFYEVGIVVDGSFVALMELKGGDFEHRVRQWKTLHPKTDQADAAE